MALQLLVGPVLSYNGLEKYQFEAYHMRVPESDYLSLALPGVVAFIFGLNLFAVDRKGEKIDNKTIGAFLARVPNLPIILIAVGFLSSLISNVEIPSVNFLFVLLGGLKFPGLYLMLLSENNIKLLPLSLVITSIIASSLGTGMFHDLLTWLLFTGAILAIKYNPSHVIKISAFVFFAFLGVVIQQLKGDFRSTGAGNLSSFIALYEIKSSDNTLFTLESLGQSAVRINQGFIISNIMINVPSYVPFQNGDEIIEILKAGFLPRFLAPNKLKAGDVEHFMKFSGMHVAANTSMGLGAIGDFYLNFGVNGAIVSMFLLGLFFNWIISRFNRNSRYFPVLPLFLPLVMYYPIRPDCELQTVLGHIVKSVFLVFALYQIFKLIKPEVLNKYT